MDKCERIQPSCGEWPELEATARAALPEDEPRSLILYNINVTIAAERDHEKMIALAGELERLLTARGPVVKEKPRSS